MMDEFRLIERIHNIIEDKQPGVRVGIGDDAALFSQMLNWRRSVVSTRYAKVCILNDQR
ncbi:hypothetical protein JCM19037_3576 [Geomicrobium sp. JCM 19037]|uniref:hypothetical protein n=1 Tax=Geomicrobium sp. JCM 19037 TaxID=1460634 RepID=UPI00045F2CF1|nr:hypothetical protein [Geomicrobium sp. JCM 19037]GAK05106.1 hypothetical protein JCM19037_3576 [Geomicrobium sp. JCM 19037]